MLAPLLIQGTIDPRGCLDDAPWIVSMTWTNDPRVHLWRAKYLDEELHWACVGRINAP